jgi:hypothetical protein
MNLKEEDPRGCLIKIDGYVPNKLHDKLDNLPPCIGKRKIKYNELSQI